MRLRLVNQIHYHDHLETLHSDQNDSHLQSLRTVLGPYCLDWQRPCSQNVVQDYFLQPYSELSVLSVMLHHTHRLILTSKSALLQISNHGDATPGMMQRL